MAEKFDPLCSWRNFKAGASQEGGKWAVRFGAVVVICSALWFGAGYIWRSTVDSLTPEMPKIGYPCDSWHCGFWPASKEVEPTITKPTEKKQIKKIVVPAKEKPKATESVDPKQCESAPYWKVWKWCWVSD